MRNPFPTNQIRFMNHFVGSSSIAFQRSVVQSSVQLASSITLVLACFCGLASADDPPGAGFSNAPGAGFSNASGAGFSNAPANEVSEFKGTLKGMQRGVLQVTHEDGTDVQVQVPAQAPSLTFVAQAKPPFLQRGMLVRFSGTFSPAGVAAVPIDKVEIFQPVNLQGVPGHSRERFMPGVHPADRHAGKKKPVGIAKYTVVGSLMGINGNGAIMVQAGKIPVVAPLAQTAFFEIRFHNLSLAQEGDAISVAGFYEPPDDTKIRGNKITVTTERIYGEPQQVPPRRSRRVSKRQQTKLDAENAAKEKSGTAEEENAKPGAEDAEKMPPEAP